MKLSKKLCALSLAAVMSLSVYAPAFAAEAAADNAVDVQYNGQTTEDAALLVNGSTYVKAADVKTLFGVDCTVTDGKAVLTVNGAAVNVDAQVAEGDLVPVRAITTALGYSLGWDDAAKTAVVVNVDKMVADSGQTFEIIGKYMDYALSLGENYKTTSEFSGNVEVVDTTATMKLPFSGTTTGVTSSKGEDMTMKLTLDFTQIKELLEAQGINDAEKETFDTIVKALESSETKYIYDLEKNIFYMNSTMFTALGLSADTWVSLDLNALFNAVQPGFDFTSILDLASKGDFNGYITEFLKAIPVTDVNTYSQIAAAYDTYAKMLGDKSFILVDGQYKLNYSVNENGTELTYAMTLGTDGDKVNSCTLAMKVAADGIAMDISVDEDKDFNSTMVFTMNLLDMMKMDMNFKSSSAATTETPQLTVPEGATVISLNDLLTGVTTLTADGVEVPATAVPETAAEATEAPAQDAAIAETATETPAAAETTEAPAQDAAVAETATEAPAAAETTAA